MSADVPSEPRHDHDTGEHHGPLHAIEEAVEHAVDEVEEVDEELRASGLWIGWLWLVLGVATTVFLLVFGSGSDSGFALAVALAFAGISLALALWAELPSVTDSVGAKLERPVTRAYFVAAVIAVVVILLDVLPEGFSAGLLLIALLPAIPCLIGAYRVLVTHR